MRTLNGKYLDIINIENIQRITNRYGTGALYDLAHLSGLIEIDDRHHAPHCQFISPEPLYMLFEAGGWARETLMTATAFVKDHGWNAPNDMFEHADLEQTSTWFQTFAKKAGIGDTWPSWSPSFLKLYSDTFSPHMVGAFLNALPTIQANKTVLVVPFGSEGHFVSARADLEKHTITLSDSNGEPSNHN